MTFDVAVIGAGIIGASVAFRLAARGLSVAILDSGRAGASAAAAGMLSPSFETSHEAGSPAFRASLEKSLGLWDSFAHAVSDDPFTAFGYRRDGVYGIGFHARPEGSDLPAPGALPAFARKPSAFVPWEGVVEPERLIGALLRRAEAFGARRIVGEARLQDGNVLVGDVRISAGNIVITTGAGMGLAPPGLQAVIGRAFIARLAAGDRDAVPAVVRSPTAYFVPRQDGTLYVGATEEWPGAIAPTPDELWRDAERLLPCLDRAERLAVLTGRRPFVRREGPVILREEGTGLIRAQGHHRNGVLLAPLTAETVLELLLGKSG